MTKNKNDNMLGHMTWPPQLPDLNPIAMIWDEMDCRVEGKAVNKCSGLLGMPAGKPFVVAARDVDRANVSGKANIFLFGT